MTVAVFRIGRIESSSLLTCIGALNKQGCMLGLITCTCGVGLATGVHNTGDRTS